MSRDEGVKIIRNMDHVKPNDLERWLTYVGMSEQEFDEIADSFRDDRVWHIKDGLWWKDDILGKSKSYGKSYLSTQQQKKYES
jgi:hypothetical protein